MDFLTTLAYVAILILVIANVIIVRRMRIEIHGEKDD